MTRAQAVERAARALLDRVEDDALHPADEFTRVQRDALRAALSLPPEAAAPVANPVDACPMCKSAWPSVLYDPCERMTAPNSWHYSVPPPREGG